MHLLDPDTINSDRAALLVLFADRSTCTQNVANQDCDGLIENGDRVVVSDGFIMWLDLVTGSTSNTDGGAGMLRGIWSIDCCDGSGNWNFKFIENTDNWAPNEMLPGATGGSNGGSGMSLQLRLINNQDTPDPYSVGVENTGEFTLTIDGDTIDDGGLFSGDGVFYQTQGLLCHFERDQSVLNQYGFQNMYDMNNDINLDSQIQFTLTYRIGVTASFFRQEMTLYVIGPDPTSPIATYVMSSCGFGSASWSANQNWAQVGRIRNGGVSPPSCSAPAQYAAEVAVPFDESVISSGGLDYFENNVLAQVGQVWYITGPSGRTWYLSLPSPGWNLPDHVQPLLNGYDMSGSGIVCIDINYTNVNDCGSDSAWPYGYEHLSATDYATSIQSTKDFNNTIAYRR